MQRIGQDFAEAEGQVRLLLSWREQVRRLAVQAEKSKAEGGIDAKHFESLRRFYGAQRRRAETRLERLRERERAHLDRIAGALRADIQRRAQWHAQQSGADTSQGPPRAIRRIEAHIDACREAIAHYNRLLTAQSPEDLGGFVSLPLERYEEELAAGGKHLFAPLTARDKHQILVSAIVLMAAVLGVLYYGLKPGPIRFEAGLTGAGSDRVRLLCTNESGQPLIWQVPWTGNKPADSQSYGVQLYARQTGHDDYRLLQDAAGAWTYQGVRMDQRGEPIVVNPGLVADVYLELSAPELSAGDIEAIRLVCVCAGDPVYTATIPVP